MITHIELTNFMSHTKTVIEPSPGLTVLVGPNNCGKSAVVAALQILCYNDNSTYVTRHGEKECSVVVRTSEGDEIRWGRKNSPSYVINGQKFDRLRGSGLPDELHQALKLPKVDAGEANEFDVHFGTQKSPIFLLGGSESTAARFFASSSDAVHLVAMQRRHKEKQTQARSRKQDLEARSRTLNEELEALQPVVTINDQLSQAEDVYHELQDLVARLAHLEGLETNFRRQLRDIEYRTAEVEAFSSLVSPPSLTPTEPIETLLVGLVQAEANVSKLVAVQEALAPLPEPPQLGDVDSLESSLSRIIAESQRLSRAEVERHALEQLQAPPQLLDTDFLERAIARMEQAETNRDASERQFSILQQLGSPPRLENELELERLLQSLEREALNFERWQKAVEVVSELPELESVSVGPLEDLLLRLMEVQDSVQAGVMEVEAISREVSQVEQELRAAANEATCPTCGAPLDPDRVISQAAVGIGGHAHG